jgi:hypothetical protein
MRWNEMKEGINVKDKDGTPLGVSVVCGQKAIFETVLTRVALPAPSNITITVIRCFNYIVCPNAQI